ncbi:MAG: Rrf2 family transcriptional regulator [Bacteroidales bacterium]|nr:Rrf2 family transcriptional regulator [Bacteroidales bacterium]
MLSNTCKYAIRAALYLALNTDKSSKVGIKVISKDLSIPSPFLAKILQVLAKNRIFSSTKGPNGGFGLLKDPYKITLFDIVILFDGDDLFEKCIISLRSCRENGHPCPMHDKYEEIRKQIKSMFKEQNIGNLADEIRKNQNIII